MASPVPLAQIQNKFTEMFLIMPSNKFAQTVPLHQSRRAATSYPEPLVQIRNSFTKINLVMLSTKSAKTFIGQNFR